jgi:hypothetical protein
VTRVHLTTAQLRQLEAEHDAELAGDDDLAPYDYFEPPHPRQLSIFDALSAKDLQAYLQGAST